MRCACVLIPHVFVRLEQRDQPALRQWPVIVGGAPGERPAVVDCSPEAARQGVAVGMLLRQAMARCRDAIVVTARPAVYGDASRLMCDALSCFSPRMHAGEPGRVLLDLDGTARLWPEEHELARSLGDAVVAACRLRPQVGIADGPFAAQAAARCARPRRPLLVPLGQAPSFLATLPVDYLPVSAEMRRRLRLVGLHTLGDLAALPVGAVQAQFGPEGRQAWLLASGADDAPLPPRHSTPVLTERVELPAPTPDRTTLLRAADIVLRRLLRRRELGTRCARRLTVAIAVEGGRTWERTSTFPEPTADHETMLRAVRTRLEPLDLPAAATGLTLTLHDLCGERGRQAHLFATGRMPAQLDQALHQLRTRLGPRTTPVLRLVAVEPWSRIPERRMALTEYLP